jgi:hypothetical protein
MCMYKYIYCVCVVYIYSVCVYTYIYGTRGVEPALKPQLRRGELVMLSLFSKASASVYLLKKN